MILVVDDDEILLSVIVEILNSQGHKTASCTSLEEALQALDELPEVTTLITDDMVRRSSISQTLITAAREKYPSVHCVVMTGHITRALADGLGPTVKLMQKPMGMKEILDAVDG